ncbi:MAG: dihydropteroate synthase [Alphaproteobacteria bacterium]|jgi:dihydropteroate synthase
MRLSRRFDWTARTFVMGILNVTPDSFSGDGLQASGDADIVARAVAQARGFVESGVDILDVGAESTRPGAEILGAAAETARLLPVITGVRAQFPDIPISVDTYRASVAAAALDAGADMINDVWGFRADPEMAGLAATRGAPVILMHNRSTPGDAEIDTRLGGVYRGAQYDDFLAEIVAELRALADDAIAAGVDREQIILDPGLGFGKSVAQNLTLMNNLDAIVALGYPVLMGPSRKSFIGRVLDLPVDQRLEGTAAAVTLCITRGANIVRVHDVTAMTRVAAMTDAMLRAAPTQRHLK